METQLITESKEVVMSLIDALNKEDFKTGRSLVSDDMEFIGVLGSRHGGDAYFKDMELMKLKYDIKKVFADEGDVCLFYDLKISGATIFGCAWYTVKNAKVISLKVLFDPRPVLEASQKK
jgi:hypothetical protein